MPQHGLQVNEAPLQIHPAGFDLGQIQQIVDQGKQVLAGSLDHRDALELVGTE